MICTPAASSHLSFAMPLLFLCFSYGETHFDSSKPLSLNLLNIPFPAVSHSLLLAVQLNSRGSPVKLARHLHVSLFYAPTALLNYGSTKILFLHYFSLFPFLLFGLLHEFLNVKNCVLFHCICRVQDSESKNLLSFKCLLNERMNEERKNWGEMKL